jgi:hypothetical protein
VKHQSFTSRFFAGIGAALLLAVASPFAFAGPGAIFTSEGTCDGTNTNLFPTKDAVYLDGGPAHPGAAGLDNGSYWVRIIEPGGTVLGASTSAIAVVSSNEFASCYQLTAIVYSASSGFTALGYDTTTNGGGEYKVQISSTSSFSGGDVKSDNFKVGTQGGPPDPPVVPTTKISGHKFYDSNLDGIQDPGEPGIPGVVIQVLVGTDPDAVPQLATTDANGDWSADIVADLGIAFVVSETVPATGQAGSSWIQTAPAISGLLGRVYNGSTDGSSTTYVHLDFGDACIHPLSGGFTLGFWSNKNGQAILQANDAAWRAKMNSSNLRDAKGNLFTLSTTDSFTNVYGKFRTWILGATATNMAYMLSAQLAATTNDVCFKGLDGTQVLQLTPELAACYGSNVATINTVIAQAKASLATNGNTVQAGATRTYQECLKNILDGVNNNAFNVVSQPVNGVIPCDVVYVQ